MKNAPEMCSKDRNGKEISTHKTCPIQCVLCVWINRIRAKHERSNYTHEMCPYGCVSCVWLKGDSAKHEKCAQNGTFFVFCDSER